MRYIYFAPDAKIASLSPDLRPELGQLIGTFTLAPDQQPPRTAFLVQNLLANAGYRGLSGVTIHTYLGPEAEDRPLWSTP